MGSKLHYGVILHVSKLATCKKEKSFLIKKRHNGKHGSLGGLGWKEEKEVLQFVAISFGGYQIWEPKHKIYDYLRKDTAQVTFKEKAKAIAPQKDDVVINMVLVVTTCG
jgi:hypothetical protein